MTKNYLERQFKNYDNQVLDVKLASEADERNEADKALEASITENTSNISANKTAIEANAEKIAEIEEAANNSEDFETEIENALYG